MSNSLASAIRGAATRLRDWAKYSRPSHETLAAAEVARYWLNPRRIGPLVRAYQRTEVGPLRRYAARALGRRLADPGSVPDDQLGAGLARYLGQPELTRSIILKAPGPGDEKGVLLLTAEANWVKLLNTNDVADVGARFTLLLSAGWSPLDYSLVGLALRRTTGPVFIEPANYAEVPRIETLNPRVKCLPTLCSDWIHPGLFRPKPRDARGTDLLMVANWAPFKRHWHFFSALRRMPPKLRVTLIGQPDGPFALDRVRQQARDFGAPQDIRYIENVRVEKVYEAMCDSRGLVLMSRQEGPCVAVTEAMFADTPVAMLRDAHIGTRAYINERTGVLLDHRRVACQLLRMLQRIDEYRPREWAEAHISCHVSLARWNNFLRQQAAGEGRPWTRDLVPFCWKPYTTYLKAEDRAAMEPVYLDLRARHPKTFGADFLSSALTPATP
jgi:glycosyltransferase involved in cell wall biosynthesis